MQFVAVKKYFILMKNPINCLKAYSSKIFYFTNLIIITIITLSQGKDNSDSFQFHFPSVSINIDSLKQSFYKDSGYVVLSSLISSRTIGPESFVIKKNLIIPENVELKIIKGTKIFCEPQVKILVNGKFTGDNFQISVLPASQLYAQIDKADTVWKGIQVGTHGYLAFSKVTISHAVKPITLQSEMVYMSLNNTIFQNCSNEKVVFVNRKSLTDISIPFFKYGSISNVSNKNFSIPDTLQHSSRGNLFRYGNLIVGIIAGGTAIYEHLQVKEYQEKASQSDLSISKVKSYMDKSDKSLTIRNVSMGISMVGISAFSLTFVF